MAATRRLTQLLGTVSDRLALPSGQLIVALSGGADSAALAYLVSQSDREVTAIHINHGLASSLMMERATTAIAERIGISVDVREVVVPQGPSPEGQARRARYAEFASAVPEIDGSLLTAHTRDDNVETVLFNMIRGTGARGLAGIPYHRANNVFRPMLAVTRDETREIASLAELPFVDDPMNDDLTLTRNIVRARIVPMLSELNPRLPESISRLATAVASDNAYLDSQVGRIGIAHGEGSVGVAVGELLAVARPLADRVLKEMLGHAIGRENVSAGAVQKLWSVATTESPSQQLQAGVTVRRQGPMLVICEVAESVVQASMLTPGRHRVGSLVFDVLGHDDVCKVAPLSRWSAVFAPSTHLEVTPEGLVIADGEPAWLPGKKRMPVAWYEPGSVGYLSVFAREETGWTSNP